MWVRVIAAEGGLVTPHVLSCYRMSSGNETTRQARTGAGLREIEKLNQMFVEKYPDFDSKKAVLRLCDLAKFHARQFQHASDAGASRLNWDYWKRNMPFKTRLRIRVDKLAQKILGDA